MHHTPASILFDAHSIWMCSHLSVSSTKTPRAYLFHPTCLTVYDLDVASQRILTNLRDVLFWSFADVFGKDVKYADLVNAPPVCAPDVFEMTEDNTLDVQLAVLLKNDRVFTKNAAGKYTLTLTKLFTMSHELKINGASKLVPQSNIGAILPNEKETTHAGLLGEFFTSETRLFETLVPDMCFDKNGAPYDGKPVGEARLWPLVHTALNGSRLGEYSQPLLFQLRDTFGQGPSDYTSLLFFEMACSAMNLDWRCVLLSASGTCQCAPPTHTPKHVANPVQSRSTPIVCILDSSGFPAQIDFKNAVPNLRKVLPDVVGVVRDLTIHNFCI